MDDRGSCLAIGGSGVGDDPVKDDACRIVTDGYPDGVLTVRHSVVNPGARKIVSKRKIATWWLGNKQYPESEVASEWGHSVNDVLCCWRCGYNKGIERAHIQSHSSGGSGNAENLLLLCRVCHDWMPDGGSRTDIIEWVIRGERDDLISRLKGMFTLAGTTIDEFAERHGDKSSAVFKKIMKAAYGSTAAHSRNTFYANVSNGVRRDLAASVTAAS